MLSKSAYCSRLPSSKINFGTSIMLFMTGLGKTLIFRKSKGWFLVDKKSSTPALKILMITPTLRRALEVLRKHKLELLTQIRSNVFNVLTLMTAQGFKPCQQLAEVRRGITSCAWLNLRQIVKLLFTTKYYQF